MPWSSGRLTPPWAWADTEAELHRNLEELETLLAGGAGPIRLSEEGELVIAIVPGPPSTSA